MNKKHSFLIVAVLIVIVAVISYGYNRSTDGGSYKVSFFDKLLVKYNLASAFEALSPGGVQVVPYIPVVQHDDLSQLAPEDVGKARKDFAPDYAKLATVAAKGSGKWSEIFKGYTFSSEDVVLIPSGVNVIFDLSQAEKIKAIAVKGSLELDSNESVNLKVGTIILYEAAKFTARPNTNVTHQVIFDGTIDRNFDPYQMTIGVVSVGGRGEFTAIGSSRGASYAKIISGSGSALKLETDPGWSAGDEILLYENSNVSMTNVRMARMRISAISGGNVTLEGSIPFSPSKFAVLSSRNLIFRSAESGNRAQMMFLGNTKLTFKNAALVDMGRTTTSVTVNARKEGDVTLPGSNQIGRYPIHAHHLQQSFAIENSVIYGDRLEKVLYYPGNKRVPVDPQVPLSLYLYNGSDPQIGGNEPVVWPASHSVVISFNGRWKMIKNPGGELPPVETTGYKTLPTRVTIEGEVEMDNGGWQKSGWKKYDAILEGGAVYGKDLVTGEKKQSNVRYIEIPLGAPKWGIVNHNSFGTIKNNAIIGAEGAGISTEEGMEFGSIDHNLVVGLGGGTSESDDVRWWGFALKKLDLGYGGHGYWFASTMPEVTNNIADGLFRIGAFTFYKPYDISVAVLAGGTSGGGQFTVPSLPGIPEEIQGFHGHIEGVRKIKGNTSYADIGLNEKGEEGHSLILQNIQASFFETTDPIIEISDFTGYKHGVFYEGGHPVTFKNLILEGKGLGVGSTNYRSQSTFINSVIKGFKYAFNLEKTPVRVIDSSLSNIPSNLNDVVRVVSETGADIKKRAEGELKKYKAEALVKFPLSQFLAVLDHDSIKSPTVLSGGGVSGFAVITVNEEAKTFTITWNFVNVQNKIMQIQGLARSADSKVKSTVSERFAPLFLIKEGAIEPSGERTFELSGGFLDRLKKGEVLIRIITLNLPFGDQKDWPEAQGFFKSVAPIVKVEEPLPPDDPFEDDFFDDFPPEEDFPTNPPIITNPPDHIPPPVILPPTTPAPIPTPVPAPAPAPVPENSGSSKATYTPSSNGVSVGGTPTMTVSRVNIKEDRASQYTFSPGSYGGNFDDWVFDVTLTLPVSRKIYQMQIASSGQNYATLDPRYWPIVVYNNSAQMHSSYKDPFGIFPAGTHTFRVYAQQRSSTFDPNTKLYLSFDQGDSLSAEVK